MRRAVILMGHLDQAPFGPTSGRMTEHWLPWPSRPGSPQQGPSREARDASSRQGALFLDVDGTLLDIAPHPAQVCVPPGLISVLATLAQALGGALALVSGRPVAELDSLFYPLMLPAAGQHGAELRRESGGHVVMRRGARVSRAVKRGLAALTEGLPGAWVEDKGATAALHYRAVPQAAQALEARVVELAAAATRPHVVVPGRKVWEVRRPGFDKGGAVELLMARAPFRGRVPVFVGDDHTDEDGFAAARRLGGHAIAVGRSRREAELGFADPAAVRAWLADLPERLRRAA
jgi:trehalose 6-phosphate phosphatase